MLAMRDITYFKIYDQMRQDFVAMLTMNCAHDFIFVALLKHYKVVPVRTQSRKRNS